MVGSEGHVVLVPRRGGPETMRVEDLRPADPASGSIRIRTQASGVAYGDLLLREGLVPGTAYPVVPGYDAVGVVDAVGGAATGFGIGDRVVVRTAGTGGYASHVEVPAAFAVPVPLDLDAAEVVALALNYVTAWQMLHRVAPVPPGGTVLIHSAAGGVGSALTELALRHGLRVIGTASTSRLAPVRDRGAIAVDRAGAWTDRVREIAPDGVDAAFDGVGGRTSTRSFHLLGAGGRLVVYGVSGGLRDGRRDLLALGRTAAGTLRTSALGLFQRGVGVEGYLSASYVLAHPDRFRSDLTRLIRLLAEGGVRPDIAARLELGRAAEAHRLLAQGVGGKIVLMQDPA